MLARVHACAVIGIEALPVTVEVNVDAGIGYHLVGLPDSAIRESNYRIAAALLNNGYRIPGKKITVNMAPADLRKEGAAYDLCLAVGILSASGQQKFPNLEECVIMGELSLDGELQPIKGALPIAIRAASEGYRKLILPKSSAPESAVVSELEVYGARNLVEVIRFLQDGTGIGREKHPEYPDSPHNYRDNPDFSEVKGQEAVKRCMEIAAAGGHNIIMIGPPGSGKTMLAKRLPGILPPMTREEAIETTKIHSVAGKNRMTGLVSQRPFRSPHHTVSDVALVGGGSYPQPGEISLAHNGILFLDELPEFKRHVLEVLRQPLEDRMVTLARARYTLTYPCSFTLVASMNPSPGGYFEKEGEGNLRDMQRYLGRISGPLLDRIDMHVEINPVPFRELDASRAGESSSTIRNRVVAARYRQTARFGGEGTHCNAQMTVKQLRRFCNPEPVGSRLLGDAMDRLGLSARAYDRILKLARTIADLENKDRIQENHIAEAIQYRSLDRDGWLG